MSIKKRGRPPKGFAADLLDIAGLATTPLSAEEFARKLNSDGALRIKTTSGEIHQWWRQQYQDTLGRVRTDREARREATAATAKKFGISKTRVQQINRYVAGVEKATAEWVIKHLQPELKEFEQLRAPVQRAVMIVQGAQYRDLIGACSLDLAPFDHRNAIKPGSPQRLASVLAMTFLRAHQARIEAEECARQAELHADKAEKQLKSLQQAAVARKAVPGFSR